MHYSVDITHSQMQITIFKNLTLESDHNIKVFTILSCSFRDWLANVLDCDYSNQEHSIVKDHCSVLWSQHVCRCVSAYLSLVCAACTRSKIAAHAKDSTATLMVSGMLETSGP